ncbi:SAP-like protein BP-73 isoform X1 [Beta vulgaris subsp. vulgaris]|uniref:SAP-like protein BP-73 isoform X1 n=1 Tax=Beta vulgaris subsp. vulgaris TaxID=3555 RepID=UPI00254909FE|nr:SAP-like protein BP-73 isoform X1 [Beta vulgaris subsp. vulgaris]
MDATALSFSLLTNPYLSYPTSFLLGDTVCRLLPVASCKTLSFQLKNSNTKVCATNRGDSPTSKKSIVRRAFREDEFSTRTSSDSKSLNRDKLIALFRRIQIEISGEESGTGKYSESSQASIDDDSSVETSVLEFLQQSNKESKGEGSRLKRSEDPSRNRKTTRKEKSVHIPQSATTNTFTRPPSNFVKKSPIPSATPFESNEIKVSNREESSSEADEESLKVERMKLSELKVLAKERGIRGYSKLKKSELVELLKSQVNV